LTITAQRFGPPLPHTLPHMIMTYFSKLSTTDFICGSVEALPSHAIKPKKGHSMTIDNFEKFFTATLEAAAFTDLDCPDSETYGAELSIQAKEKLERDALKFWTRCKHLIDQSVVDQAGHDFWLTRNGHGAGFWDRSDDTYFGYQDFFTKISKAHGEIHLLLGDDGFAHIA